MVLANSGSGLRRQVFPVDYETELSQRLVEAAYYGDTDAAFDCVANPSVDVNFVGTVSFKSKTTEIVLQDESPHRVNSAYEEFKTELTALFLAAHTGNLTLLRKLLVTLLDAVFIVFCCDTFLKTTSKHSTQPNEGVPTVLLFCFVFSKRDSENRGEVLLCFHFWYLQIFAVVFVDTSVPSFALCEIGSANAGDLFSFCFRLIYLPVFQFSQPSQIKSIDNFIFWFLIFVRKAFGFSLWNYELKPTCFFFF